MPVNPKAINNSQNQKPAGQPEADWSALLAKNIELSEEILQNVKYIKKYIFWQKIYGLIKILVIILPLVFGYIMLAPYLSKAFQQYQELLNLKTNAQHISAPPVNIDLSELNKFKNKAGK